MKQNVIKGFIDDHKEAIVRAIVIGGSAIVGTVLSMFIGTKEDGCLPTPDGVIDADPISVDDAPADSESAT